MSVAFVQNLGLFPLPITRPRMIILPRRHHRAWKHRRLKCINVRCLLNPIPSPFDDLFYSLLSQISSVGSFDYVAPALGLVSGLALFFSANSSKLISNPRPIENPNCNIGEWILFTSPTPFNRFVTLRCPSICFPGDGNLNEKLVKEDRHYVKLNTGRMIGMVNVDDDVDEDIEFQRICVGTSDGGVLALDWPASLDMEEETGLDTTVFIVPGTAEGSKEKGIKLFVSECLRRGSFPVVMNPRGCGGSPVTSARLFTAADSDDVFTAVQFINKKRPLSTLMGVGWGYGANMLTKHLAEFGEKTPLTAASCIDIPFDLEEVTRSFYHKGFYHTLRDGLIKILQSNKELFQGRGKGFDIEKALSAPSIRHFDQAISVVSNGVDTIEDFYANCSTRDVIGKLKIPVLFIQNGDGKVPMFSVPRGSIAENPYTSLLLCVFSPSREVTDDLFSFSWCQHLTLEWLAAVELGLLKGRHPLLRDVDITISPSKGLSVSENRASGKKGRGDKQLKLANRTSAIPPFDMLPTEDMTMNIQSRYENTTRETFTSKKVLQEKASNDDQRSPTIDPVVQAAHVVLNMLDVTLPDTLSDEQKRKVLNAVGRGETLLQALQDAVPEEVRGKLTSAVSEILQSHGSDIKFHKILGEFPEVSLGRSFEVLQKIKQTTILGNKDDQPLDNGVEMTTQSPDKPAGDVEFLEKQPEIPLDPQNDSRQSTTHDMGRVSNFKTENTNELGKSDENVALNGGEPDAEATGIIDSNQGFSSTFEGSGEAEGSVADQNDMERDSGANDLGTVEVNDHHGENIPAEQVNLRESDHSGDQSSAAPAASEAVKVDSEAGKNQKKEDGFLASVDSPRFNVSQAIDALTGLDDSTQVAVNSVFHVIEDMIDKLDGDKDRENKVNSENLTSEVERTVEVMESNSVSFSDGAISKSGHGSRKTDGENSRYRYEDHHLSGGGTHDSVTNHTKSHLRTEDDIDFLPSAGEKHAWHSVNNGFKFFLSYLAAQPHAELTYNDYLNAYLYYKARNPMVVFNRIPDLYLHYFPEEDKWKFLDQSEENNASVKETSTSEDGHGEDLNGTNSKGNRFDTITGPFTTAADSAKSLLQIAETKGVEIIPEIFYSDSRDLGEYKVLIKKVILERLKAEVSRRTNISSMERMGLKLSKEIEYVANVVCVVALQENGHIHKEDCNQEQEIDILDAESITVAILTSVQNTEYLKRVLPPGVLVGSSLVELRKFFTVASLRSVGEKSSGLDEIKKSSVTPSLFNQNEGSDLANSVFEEDCRSSGEQNDAIVVGAITAALGSSALLAHQHNTRTNENLNPTQEEKENSQAPSKLVESNERAENTIVTNLAEKAMSVASPMVPVKDDGKLDQERMVALLTELGQKGGFLKLFGKVALLWGGIRGAMSLADKLILFLRIAERPLFQRILSFAFMVLLLWSPVILPLLPTLMQSCGKNNPFKVVEFSCIAGLYVSTIIMIALWGKRIRKYEDPLMQYGLKLTSASEFQNFLKGLIGGIVLVILIHTVNSLIGCVNLRWPSTLSSNDAGTVALVGSYAWTILYVVQGLATATGASIVEELLFRSWLPQEIAADLGHHQGIVISGLIFALSQRSKMEIPGLWLLSFCLSGARERSRGSLSLVIGLRAGIIASNFILRTGGFLYHHRNFPPWLTGGQPFQPFSGVVGLAFSFILAVILYPIQAPHQKKPNRVIRP